MQPLTRPTQRPSAAPARSRYAAMMLAIAACLMLVGARGARRPIQLRVEGYLEAAPDGVRTSRTITVQVGKGKTQATRKLAVDKLVNLSSGALGATILDELARYTPSLRLVGDGAAL